MQFMLAVALKTRYRVRGLVFCSVNFLLRLRATFTINYSELGPVQHNGFVLFNFLTMVIYDESIFFQPVRPFFHKPYAL